MKGNARAADRNRYSTYSTFQTTPRSSLNNPSTVHIAITNRCNLSCKHCDIWKIERERELELSDWMSIAEKITSWLGSFTVKFAGGEPFMRKDILKIISFFKENGIQVGINTNGVLITPKVADTLLAMDVNEVNISLDSCKSDTHDFIRNRKGTYERVQNVIGYLREANKKISINVSCVIMEHNLDDIVYLLIWCKEQKINVVTFQALFQNFGNDYNPNWYNDSDLFPKDLKRINSAFEKLFEFKMRNGLVSNSLVQLSLIRTFYNNPAIQSGHQCRAGTTDIAVDAMANMRLCFNLEPIGSLLKEDPEEIFHSKTAWVRRQEISECQRSCNLLNCHYTT